MTIKRIAQRRSFLSKVRETVSPERLKENRHFLGEKNELGEKMEMLREIDAQIRETTEGSRDDIRNAKSFNRQRQYANAAANVVAFHQKCARVAAFLRKALKNLEIDHIGYARNSADPDALERIQNYNGRQVHEACKNFDQLVKEALSPMDVYYGVRDKADVVTDVANNVLTPTGWGNRGVQNSFNFGFNKDFKNRTNQIVDASEKMFRQMLNAFSSLDSGLSRRKPDLYVKGANDFLKNYTVFHDAFLKYDDEILQKIRVQKQMDRELMKDESERAQVQNIKEDRARQNMDVNPTPGRAPLSQKVQLAPPSVSKPPSLVPVSQRAPIVEPPKANKSFVDMMTDLSKDELASSMAPDTLKDEETAPDTERAPDTVRSPVQYRRVNYLPSDLKKKEEEDRLYPDEIVSPNSPFDPRNQKAKAAAKMSNRLNLLKKANELSQSSWEKFKAREKELLDDEDEFQGRRDALRDIADEADGFHAALPENPRDMDIPVMILPDVKDHLGRSPEDPDYQPPLFGDKDIDNMLKENLDDAEDLTDDALLEEDDVLKHSNDKFIRRMTKLAALNDEHAMIATILDHSERIETLDPKAAARLLSVSAKMIEKKKIMKS